MATMLSTSKMNEVLDAELAGSTVEDYDSTSFLLVNDGASWQLLEDSLTHDEAHAMAEEAERKHGEWMGVYHHTAT